MTEEIVVIGAGIVGAACAARLVMAGKKVAIVDRLGPGEACSFGNAGGLSPSISFPLATPSMYRHIPGWLLDPDGPLVVAWKHLPAAAPWLMRFLREGLPGRSKIAAEGMRAMMRGSLDDYEPLFRFADAQSLIHHVGQLYLFSTEEGFREEQGAIAARRSLGFPQEVLSAEQLHAYEPDLASIFHRGIFLPTHGHCSNPQRLVQLLIEACVRNGARFITGSVSRLEPLDDAVRIHGLGEPLLGSQVVLAGGIWSNELLRPLGTAVPLESHRGYHVQIPYTDVKPRRNVLWVEKKTLVTPMNEGIRVAGTAEIAGLTPPPTPRRFELLRQTVREIYPELQDSKCTEWMGHRPCTPDSLPVIGPLPSNRRVICAFGHGHVGLSGASFTGRVVRDIVMLEGNSDEWTPYSIKRFL
jgi:D-amino-acid dehydrogenase